MTGTARGQSQLRQAFVFTNTYALLQPEVLVGRAHEKFDAEVASCTRRRVISLPPFCSTLPI